MIFDTSVFEWPCLVLFFNKDTIHFSKKAGLIFKIFISVSWLTFLAAIYFGYKNFTIEYILIGIVISVAFVHVGYLILGKFLKFNEKQLLLAKNFSNIR